MSESQEEHLDYSPMPDLEDKDQSSTKLVEVSEKTKNSPMRNTFGQTQREVKVELCEIYGGYLSERGAI